MKKKNNNPNDVKLLKEDWYGTKIVINDKVTFKDPALQAEQEEIDEFFKRILGADYIKEEENK